MADDDGQERSHDASEKKRRDAAEKGQMPRSRELSSAGVLFAAAAALVFGHGPMVEAIGEITADSLLIRGPQVINESSAVELFSRAAFAILRSLAVPLGATLAAALAVGLAQTRFELATKALEPRWERLDPFAGFQQHYLSMTPLFELAKGVFKLVALGAVTWFSMRDRLHDLPGLAMSEPGQILSLLVELAWSIVVHAAPLILAIAAADYAYSAWKVGEDLKMTAQEVKEEQKEQMGDPHVRMARKQRARQIAMGNTLRRVKEADVVVTNPTHYAVALRYRPEEASAPVILAMGVDHLAMKIREQARAHDIPCVENRPLARALHAKGKAGHPIPHEFFGAVAKVLAVVYRRRRLSRPTA